MSFLPSVKLQALQASLHALLSSSRLIILSLALLLVGCNQSEELSDVTESDLFDALELHYQEMGDNQKSLLTQEQAAVLYSDWYSILHELSGRQAKWQSKEQYLEHLSATSLYVSWFEAIDPYTEFYESLQSYLADEESRIGISEKVRGISTRNLGGGGCFDDGEGNNNCDVTDPTEPENDDSCSGKEYNGQCVSNTKYYFLVAKDAINGAAATIGAALSSTASGLATAASNVVDSTLTATQAAINGIESTLANLMGSNTETCGVTKSPVEPSTGCKLWMSSDADQLSSPFFSVNRNYKHFHTNDFSLGAYWAFSFDSRIIWGLDNVE